GDPPRPPVGGGVAGGGAARPPGRGVSRATGREVCLGLGPASFAATRGRTAMTGRLEFVGVARAQRWLAIVVASLLVTSVASVGQVQHAIDVSASKRRGGPVVDKSAATPPGQPGAPGSGAGGTAVTLAGQAAAGSAGGKASVTGGKPGAITGTGTANGTGGAGAELPDFGLKTQGVTDKSVRIGVSYNVSGCGDAGAL